jgi:hypothetical protein
LFQQKKVLIVWDNFESILPQFSAGEGSDGAMEYWSNASKRDSSSAPDTPTFQHSTTPSLYSDEERSRVFDLFRDWTEGDGNGRLPITCRPAEAGLSGARKHELAGLARPDSLWLLMRVLETAGVDLDDNRLSRDRLNKLLDLLADHPLSIELVGPHLKKLAPEEIIADFGNLLKEFKRGAGVERNESLLASLAFSSRRLSSAAQTALPWLGLFSGGVFEDNLLDISGMNPKEWKVVRAELEATALIRVELDMGLPYIRFHPTLSYAVTFGVPASAGVTTSEVRNRFIEVYRSVGATAHQALFGKNPELGMELLAHEEANYLTAVRWAVEHNQYDLASIMGDTFSIYLQRSGRLRERDAWVAWLANEVGKGGSTEEAAAYERNQAQALLTQGKAEEAIRRLQDLLQRLKTTTDFDPAFQLATTQTMLGRVL